MEKQWKRLAIKVAKEAGQIMKEHYKKRKEVLTHSLGDIKLRLDREIEARILDILQSREENFAILTEERGRIGSSSLTWIIDPLDGTVNYASRLPFFCTSIALQQRNDLRLGVVYEPLRDELFVAENGEGAFLNGEKISVSERKLKHSIVEVTHFRRRRSREFIRNLALKIKKIRKFGSSALSLAYIAAGRLDVHLTFFSYPWDVAAGMLLVQEAGGQVTDLEGRPPQLEEGGFLFSNGRVHETLLDLLPSANSRNV